MTKFLLIFLTSVTMLTGTWVNYNIGDNMTVQFPTNPKTDNSFKDYTSFLSNNDNCDFSVDVSKYPEPVFPKTDKEASDLLERSVGNSKEKGTFISANKFSVGKIKGIEIKNYFSPKPSIKFIEVNRIFFLNYKLYTLRCIYKNKNELLCEKDCKHFFSSLKINNN